jgi:lipopolysaccharide transport protein LptA
MRGAVRSLGIAVTSLAWMAAAAAAAQEAPAAPPVATSLALGVAPFEVQAPPGSTVPDVANLLAARLSASGASRVTPLGGGAEAETPASTVQQWAAQADVDAVVLGRTTRLGEALSLDVRLRRGDTGEVARTFVQRVARPEDLDGAIATLADQVLAGALALGPRAAVPSAAPAEPAAAVAVASAAPASAPAPEPDPAPEASAPAAVSASAPFGFRAWKSDAPLSIQSDSLDAAQEAGRRTLVFQNGVRVTQGELTLNCDRLEAIYPLDANQPDRLVARGSVHVAQGRQQAWCDEAVYDRAKQRLRCEGNARFQDGCNQLAGRVIDIDLAKETINVTGGAAVLVQPETLENEKTQPGGCQP